MRRTESISLSPPARWATDRPGDALRPYGRVVSRPLFGGWWRHDRRASAACAADDSFPGGRIGVDSAACEAASAGVTSRMPDVPGDDPELSMGDRRRRAEAILLFHRGPASLRRVAALAGLADASEARKLLRGLNELYESRGSALRVEEVAGGFQLMTRPALAPWIRRAADSPSPTRLSTPAMETLAIVAYRQPVLRADIEAIRGVACGEILRQLMQRDLVRICGRSEDLGRPYFYGTTRHFLEMFGLKSLDALPKVLGASFEDELVDTLGNRDNDGQAPPGQSPIEVSNRPVDALVSDFPPLDAVPQEESDVSTAPGPVVLDDTDFSNAFASIACSDRLADRHHVVAIDDDDEQWDVDDDEDVVDDEVEDDLEEDDWDDDDEEDEDDEVEADVVEEDVVEEEWVEVGDDDEDEDDEDDDDEDEDEDADDADEEWEDDDDEEDDDWDDDDEDDDDEEEEEWD